MDTIGTIQPGEMKSDTPHSQRGEAFERLRYLAEERRCGLLVGKRGGGKTDLLLKLQCEVEQAGLPTVFLSLSGVVGDELPQLLALQLGLNERGVQSRLETWIALQEFAEGLAETETHYVFLLDQIDRATPSLVPVLDRVLTTFADSAAVIFASRPKFPVEFKAFFKSHSWMKVSLESLQTHEVSRTLAQKLSREDAKVTITPEAVELIDDVSNGRVDRLDRLTKLAILAAQAEGLETIDREVIQSIQAELRAH